MSEMKIDFIVERNTADMMVSDWISNTRVSALVASVQTLSPLYFDLRQNVNNARGGGSRPWVQTGDLLRGLRIEKDERYFKGLVNASVVSDTSNRHGKPWGGFRHAPYGIFLDEGYYRYDMRTGKKAKRKTKYPWFTPAFRKFDGRSVTYAWWKNFKDTFNQHDAAHDVPLSTQMGWPVK